ncbi:sulfite exporter TauE/SafE [Dongia mobilis]|uniref:Probable membrane transporter protein n=1 Tax=Dongia mobilis TaxID=578943 RepID=A0A4R6WQN0_9PROT|nr:TSUP family transporter [Dongia mobilis]TDQ80593.1 sulfite exporter TauE/SafE [Dongia mobilis]
MVGLATLLSLIAAVLATSFLSGIFGMLGGLILMALLLLALPVPAAMSLHAVTQMTANGWRALLWHRYILWRVMPGYIAGSALAFAILTWISFQPDTAWVYIGLGVIPFFALVVPAGLAPDIRRPFAPVILGMIVMAIHVVAGVSGALLDIFFFRTDLDRRQIVATKACSQTLGHLFKLAYFLLVAGMADVVNELPLWIFAISIVSAITGTTLAKFVIDRLTNRAFQLWTRWLAALVGLVCLVRGIALLMG